MKQNSRLLSLILICATLAFLPACKSTETPNVSVDKTVKPDETAPKTYKLPEEVTEAELRTLDGRTVKISDFKGKIVLINLWATWCGPCRMEIPELVKISAEMEAQGVEIIGITSIDDRGNNEDSVKAFVKQQNISYQIIWANDEVNEEFGSLANYGIPASFVLNREGELIAIYRAFNPKKTPQSIRKTLADALNEQS